MLVPTTRRFCLRGRLGTPHDVVVAIPVGRFKLLHRAILVRPHTGKVPADGPLPLARVHHSSGGTSAGPSIWAATIQPRSGGFRRGQRGHLAKQIAEIVHCGCDFFYYSWRIWRFSESFFKALITNSHDDSVSSATRENI